VIGLCSYLVPKVMRLAFSSSFLAVSTTCSGNCDRIHRSSGCCHMKTLEIKSGGTVPYSGVALDKDSY
jgi:hypothetical protein